MNNENVLEDIKKEMRIRNITEEILAEKINMKLPKLKRKLSGKEELELDEFVDILSYLDLSVKRITEIYGKYKK